MSMELIPGSKSLRSAMDAEQARLRVSAQNLANAETVSPNAEGIYKRKTVIFETVIDEAEKNLSKRFGGVRVKEIGEEDSQAQAVYAPWHPQADQESGMIFKSGINPLDEMVDMMTASRSYEAALTMMKQSKQMAERTINLGRNN